MNSYNELLDATIAHLALLKERGERYLTIDPSTIKALQGASGERPQGKIASNARPLRSSPTPAPSRPQSFLKATVPPPAAAPITEPAIAVTGDLSKVDALRELRDRAVVCQKCPNLVATRKNVVFGVGSADASLLFVGEAPGAEEDAQGEPFVGRAGQLLTKIIQAMGLTREEVYIANILKCRPDTPGQTFGNRPPTPEEMARCLPYLHAQIDIIKPKVMVALGATAIEGLFGKIPGYGITKMRGKWREYRGIPVMPTYHPSYLLRPNPNNVKKETWEDMLQVMEKLTLPISEKQRGYFVNKG